MSKQTRPKQTATRWTPFVKVTPTGGPIKAVEGGQMWANNLYTVIVTYTEDRKMAHLSIRRNDREAIRDWRHFQRIKNELVGAECEGIELFPAESRLVDTSNQYHLWVFTSPLDRIPVGWNERLVADAGESKIAANAVQRPFDADHRPNDLLSAAELDVMMEKAGYK